MMDAETRAKLYKGWTKAVGRSEHWVDPDEAEE